MSTKNLMDSTDNTKRPLVYSDKTGQYSDQPRADLADTLIFVNEAYTQMMLAESPRVHRFAMQFGLQALCNHMGWTPYEVAAAEQYASLYGSSGTATTAG